MNYEEIFGDNIYEKNNRDIEEDFDNLVKIFERNGFDKQLTSIMLTSCDLAGLSTIYKESKNSNTSERNYTRLIQSMAIVHTLIESFIASDEGIYNIVEEVRKRYIERELGKEEKTKTTSNNRIAYLLQNKK